MDSFEFSDDRSSVTIANEHGSTTYTLEQLERVISFLGAIRGQMVPAVPLETAGPGGFHPLQHLFVRHVSDEALPLKSGAVVVARSDQFGWFEFPLSAELCQGFLHWLSAQPEAICPPLGTTLN